MNDPNAMIEVSIKELSDIIGDMQDQEQITQEMDTIIDQINTDLTYDCVRPGTSYSGCYPSETSYVRGVEDALEAFKNKIFENYFLTPKTKQ